MDKELIYQSKKIFYRVIGNGDPVMLIHGFGMDGNLWNDQVDHLKNKFQLIVPDLPGSGRSEMVDDMSITGMAEVIRAIIDCEASLLPSSKEGVILIGHSMGGYITLAFAEKYADKLKAFGLFHSSAYADNEEKKATRRKGIEFINQHGSYNFLKTMIPNLFSENSRKQSRLLSGPNSIKELIEKGNNFLPAALVSYYEAMIARPDRTELLGQFPGSVLFIMGKYDTAVPIEDGLKQCHLPEKSYIHILHHSGHMGMLEETDKTNRLLEKFLEDNLTDQSDQ